MSDYVKALRNVPFMSSINTSVDIVDLFENAVDNMRLYENKEVTGLWFITEPTGDSGKQIIVRSSIPLKTKERLHFDSLLCDYIGFEIAYDYYRDFVEGSGMIISDADDIETWLDEGKILCIMDKERWYATN